MGRLIRQLDSNLIEMPRPITRRELEVARWIAQGKSNNEIAGVMGITYKTVDVHRTNLARKLGITGPTAALVTRWVIEEGLDDPRRS